MKKRKPTQAEQIINSFIEGDIRDYSEEEVKRNYIPLETALKIAQKCIRSGRKNLKKVYLLKADSDRTMRSINVPIGIATTSKNEAKKFVAKDKTGCYRSYEEIFIVDKVPEKV